MIIKKTITKEIVEETGYICDKCKKQFINNYSQCLDEIGNSAKITFNPGYGSKYDNDLWQLNLCEDCFELTYEFIIGYKMTDNSPYRTRGF